MKNDLSWESLEELLYDNYEMDKARNLINKPADNDTDILLDDLMMISANFSDDDD